jgi:Rod binding domain-containing protein
MQIKPANMNPVRPLRPSASSHEEQVAGARDLKKAYGDFVGKTFFGQMLKSMQQTVGKPAYFYGGQTEEIFRGQLNEQLADHMTKASAEKFADPMFRKQFPKQAALLDEADKRSAAELTDLSALRRR